MIGVAVGVCNDEFKFTEDFLLSELLLLLLLFPKVVVAVAEGS